MDRKKVEMGWNFLGSVSLESWVWGLEREGGNCFICGPCIWANVEMGKRRRLSDMHPCCSLLDPGFGLKRCKDEYWALFLNLGLGSGGVAY